MSHHKSYEICGQFIPDDMGGHFRVERVPLPPTGRRILTGGRDHIDRTMRETVELDVACPHCLQDVRFCYEVALATPNFVENMKNESSRVWRDAYSKMEKSAEERARPKMQMLMDSMEDLYS